MLLPTEQLADAVASGLVLLDADGRVRVWNAWMRRHCRVLVEPLQRLLEEVCDGPVEPRVYLAVREALDLGLPGRLSHALHPSPFPLFMDSTKSKRLKQSVTVSPVVGADGRRWCLIQINDVTAAAHRERLLRTQKSQLSAELRKATAAQELLRRNEHRFRELTRQAPVGIFEADPAGQVVFVNERWAQMIGSGLTDGAPEPWWSIVVSDDREQVTQAWSRARTAGERFEAEFRCQSRTTQRKFWVRLDAMPLRGADDALTGYIGTVVDIHEAKEAALRSAHQATYDTLTGLYNRSPFNERVRATLDGASEHTAFALMFIDLDGFKAVNDTHGHEAGDAVLKAVARRLRRLLRSDDVVARFGGDEFVALLPDVRHPEQIEQVMWKIERAIERPINVGGEHVFIRCSIGCARYPEDGRDPVNLMRHSDRCMYEAKRRHHQEGSGSDSPSRLGESLEPHFSASSMTPLLDSLPPRFESILPGLEPHAPTTLTGGGASEFLSP